MCSSDLQMPVMDGLSATTALRCLPEFNALPVVAMTANARAEDRLACIASGMNDFLSKPIDPDVLWSVLLKWITPRADASPSEVLPGAVAVSAVPLTATLAPAALVARLVPTGSTSELPDAVAGLDVRLGLSRMMGKKNLYITMLRKYVAGQKTCVQTMREAIASGDWATAQRTAHTLKGVSGTIGATAIPAYADALEQAIREQRSASELEAMLTALDGPLQTLFNDLETWFATLP